MSNRVTSSWIEFGPKRRRLGKNDLGPTEMPARDAPVATGPRASLNRKSPPVISLSAGMICLDFADGQPQPGGKRVETA